MRAVDHHGLRESLGGELRAHPGDVVGLVVRTGARPAAQDDVARARCPWSGRWPRPPCLVTDGNQCGDRAVSTASTAVCVLPSVLFLNPTGIDRPGRQLPVHLAFGRPGADRDPRREVGDVLRDLRVEELRRRRQSDVVDVEQELAGEPQALVDVEALVQIGIVDESLPADRRARLLEVAAHDDDELVGVADGQAAGAAPRSRSAAFGSWIEHGPAPRRAGDRGLRARRRWPTACWRRRSRPARSIGISSSRMAGGMSGRTWVMRRSSVFRNMVD